MKLAYQAFDRAGTAVTDTIDSSNIEEATESLRRKGLLVSEIHSADASTVVQNVKQRRSSFGRRLKLVAIFARQLYVLISNGAPLVDALMSLERQSKDVAFQGALRQIRSRVEEGTTLADAMAHHPEYFDSICLSLIAAGESGGSFASMLKRLSELANKQLHVRNAIVGATIYPCLLVVVALSVLTLMLLFVVPRFTDLFDTLGVPLPPTSMAMMWLSNLLLSYWYLLIGLSVGAAVGLKFWLESERGKRFWATLTLKLPRLGGIAKGFATARIARMLGVLLENHVPLIESLQLTRHATGNYHYADLITRAEEAVTHGEAISSAFDDANLISPSVFEAVRNGESNGQIGPSLLNIADFLDEENEVVVRSLTSILEPMILIVLGLLVGLVALSMFMPLFDLTAMTSG